MRRLVLALTLALVTLTGCAQPIAEPVAERIEEDHPLWDCRTMGNRICGPNATLPMGVE